MEFREGMLGVVVVALALTGALFASYFAGIESETTEYTDYDYLADISGLFDYDQSPTYIKFDPSTNYTGYYSVDTGEYWPTGLVDYEPNVNPTTQEPRANNYKLNLEPIIIESGSLDLTTITEGLVYPIDDPQVNFKNSSYEYYSRHPTTVTLASYIAALGLGSTITDFQIKSKGMYLEDTPDSTYEADWISFSTPNMWLDSHGRNHTLRMGSEQWFEKNHYSIPYKYVHSDGWTYYYYLPCLSVSVDLTRNIASLYYDNDCSQDALYTTIDLSSVYMTFGGEEWITRNIVYDDTADIIASYTDRSYLDPNTGVALTPTLVIYAFGMTGGTTTGGGRYYEGSTATIEAIPESGYTFSHWSDGNTSSSRTISVTSANVGQSQVFIAYFEEA